MICNTATLHDVLMHTMLQVALQSFGWIAEQRTPRLQLSSVHFVKIIQMSMQAFTASDLELAQLIL